MFTNTISVVVEPALLYTTNFAELTSEAGNCKTSFLADAEIIVAVSEVPAIST